MSICVVQIIMSDYSIIIKLEWGLLPRDVRSPKRPWGSLVDPSYKRVRIVKRRFRTIRLKRNVYASTFQYPGSQGYKQLSTKYKRPQAIVKGYCFPDLDVATYNIQNAVRLICIGTLIRASYTAF